MIKNIHPRWVLLAVLASAGLASGCRAAHGAEPTSLQGVIELEETPIGFELGGRLTQLLVKEGDVVEVGAVLARIDDTLERSSRVARESEAQVAKQQGEHLGRALARQAIDGGALPPFRFRDRGNTAIIGRSAAIFDFGRRRLKGVLAWLLWAIVHVYLLVSFEQRMLVSLQWLWRFLTYQRGAGRIFYFSPGHETYPIYHHKDVQQILRNAVNWACNPAPAWASITNAPNVPIESAREKLVQKGPRLHADGEEGFR